MMDFSDNEEALFDLMLGSAKEAVGTGRGNTVDPANVPQRSRFEDPEEALFDILIDGGANGNTAPKETAAPETTDALSNFQQRLWFLQQLDPSSVAYLIPFHQRIKGPLNVVALKKALLYVWSRHDALRTIFPTRDGQPFRALLPADSLPVHQYDFSDNPDPSAWKNHYLENHAGEMRLDVGPLMRASFYKIAENDHALLLDIHHINGDGFSIEILREDIFAAYEAFSKGRVPESPGETATYDAFVSRELARRDIAQRELEESVAELSGAPTLIDFFFDKPLPEKFTNLGDIVSREIDDLSLFRRAIERGRDLKLTPFMVFLTAFGATLHTLSGQTDILVGVPISVRPDESFSRTVGFFVNTCVARLDFGGNPTMREMLRRTRESVRRMMSRPEVPLDMLVHAMRDKRRADRPPLIQAILAFLMDEREAVKPPDGLRIEPFYILRNSSMFELTMDLHLHGNKGFWAVEYYSGAWEEKTAVRTLDRFHSILEIIADAPDAKLSELRRTGEAEAHAPGPVLEDKRIEESFLCVPDLVRGQALADPGKTAMVCGSLEISRANLDMMTASRRGRLRSLGLRPGDVAALACAPGVEWTATALAAMSECVVILPVETGSPPERLRAVLTDAGAKILWHDESFDPETVKGISGLECVDCQRYNDGRPIDDPTIAHPGATAYIIYTSGTTGRPKGVRVSHGAFAAHCRSAALAYGITPNDRWLALAAMHFDAFWEQLFAPLCAGASVLMRDVQIWPPDELCNRLTNFRATCADMPPQYLLEFLYYLKTKPEAVPGSLRMVISGGEAMPASTAMEWLESPLSKLPLVNAYGPTEGVVTATIARIDKSTRIETANGVVPIGRPMPGRILRILDDEGAQVAAGIPGELCIGGLCLAEGYHADAERTGRAFRQWLPTSGGRWTDAASPESVRLYRTGDRVRIGPDDNIEFLGRIDKQVKIRGFRVEPGEIEAVLARHPAIARALVTALDHPSLGRQLVAYCVSKNGETPSHEDLKAWLARLLPEHMIPSGTMFVKSFPTTSGGKTDLAALPTPEISQQATKSSKIPPVDDLEKKIAAIWAEILGRSDIGADDNFFDLGGHSILLVRLHTKLASEIGAKLRLVDLFANPTVARMAKLLRGEADAAARRGGRAKRGDVAVIGMAGRFPCASDVEEFWANLVSGRECIRFFTKGELAEAGIPEKLRNLPEYVPAHGFMDGTKLFDAGFFGYTPREAAMIDPQQRIFLQECWHALENAGCDPDRFDGDIGVFGGMGMSMYLLNNLAHLMETGQGAEAYAAGLSNDKDFITTRVSYKLNLRGPSVNVNTACSTSLVAVHLAAESILAGECELALAGGATLHVPPAGGYVYQSGGIASPDGHCRAFAEDAAGTVGGSGCGVVVLKRLERALADGDAIRAVIKASAINNDGADKVGFTAPSVGRQRDVVRAALDLSGIAARDIAYVEAHGTGTPMGDPIEIQALSQAFAPDEPAPQSCLVGSVKSNIGHLDTAAGIAGFVKTVLALERGIIPPTLHCDRPSEKIDFPHTPFKVVQKPTRWPEGRRRRAAVSSFGMGGTNAHAILEEAPRLSETPPRQTVWCLPVSARSSKSLKAFAAKLADRIDADPSIDAENLWHTLAEGRRRFPVRAIVAATSRAEAAACLRALDVARFLHVGRDGKAVSGDANPSGSLPDDPDFAPVKAFAKEWLAGGQTAASALLPKGPHRKIALPGYVFDETECWIEPEKSAEARDLSTVAEKGPVKLTPGGRFHHLLWEEVAMPPSDDADLLVVHGGGDAETRWMDAMRASGMKFSACLRGDGMAGTLAWMAGEGRLPARCLHIAALEPRTDDSAAACAERLAAIVEDIRRLAAAVRDADLAITFLHPSGDDPFADSAALSYMDAAAVVAEHEYGNIKTRVLRFDARAADPRSTRAVRSASAYPGVDKLLALSHGRLWRATHKPLPEIAPETGGARLRKGGVYLLTGGLGGMGMTFAKYLAGHFSAKLVLVSRREPTPSQLAEIRAMTALGAQVETAALDVADAAKLRELADRTIAKWGRIDGVVHAAGVAGGSLMARTGADEIERVMRPKIGGTLALREALRGREPDFVILCSSLTAAFGGTGQIAYAAANAWMDAFAEERALDSPGIWRSVRWDAWAEVGMAARFASGTVSADGAVLREWTLDPESFWPWGEHRIGGAPVLPGTAYLDLFAKALGNGMPFELDAVTLNEPLVADDARACLVSVIRRKGSLVVSSRRESRIVEHCAARLAASPPPAAAISFAKVRARCRPAEIGDASAPSENGIAIETGPRWKIAGSYSKGENEALATFELPAEFQGDLADHPLHPALFDIALSYGIVFVEGAGRMLPWRYEKVRVFAPLEPVVSSHVKVAKSTERALVLDVAIAAADGRLLAEVEGYTLVRADAPVRPAQQPTPDAANPFAMTPDEGVDAFLRALAYIEPVVETSLVEWKYAGSTTLKTPAPDKADSPRTAAKPRPETAVPYRAPSGDAENIMAGIWAEVLGYEKIGADDDLFDLGADSLTALQASARLKERTGRELPMDAFFENATLASLAAAAGIVEKSAEKGHAAWEEGEI